MIIYQLYRIEYHHLRARRVEAVVLVSVGDPGAELVDLKQDGLRVVEVLPGVFVLVVVVYP